MAARKTGGGTTALVRQIRRTEQYYEWKKAVHIRDGFACQECGARNGRERVIEADHVMSLSQLIKDNNITSLEEALECAALWVLANGRTLCHACHEQTESYPANFRGIKKVQKTPKVI